MGKAESTETVERQGNPTAYTHVEHTHTQPHTNCTHTIQGAAWRAVTVMMEAMLGWRVCVCIHFCEGTKRSQWIRTARKVCCIIRRWEMKHLLMSPRGVAIRETGKVTFVLFLFTKALLPHPFTASAMKSKSTFDVDPDIKVERRKQKNPFLRPCYVLQKHWWGFLVRSQLTQWRSISK